MIRLPEVVGILPCKELTADAATGRISLVGLFQSLHFRSFPTPAQAFTIYVALYDGAGEGKMEVLVTRLETEEDVYSYQRWFVFPGRRLLVHVTIPVKKCSFPAPGRYLFTLRLDENPLAQRLIDVYPD